jgi:hypothetical protein
VAKLINGPYHLLAGATLNAIAVLSSIDCAEPTSYRAALSNAHAPAWQAAMQHEYSVLMDNGTWEVVDLPPGGVVVNNM